MKEKWYFAKLEQKVHNQNKYKKNKEKKTKPNQTPNHTHDVGLRWKWTMWKNGL